MLSIEDNPQHQGLRTRLVNLLRDKGIVNEDVLTAMGKVPRHLFIDSSFIRFAYKDQAFPIAAGQTISQPYTVAQQSELLSVKVGDKVLEVGTGSGYQAAVLTAMGVKVYTIERQKELYSKTQHLLPEIGYRPYFYYGDGYEGLPQFAPFDGIIITAAAPEVPKALLRQLKIGGKMVIPVGEEENNQRMTVITRLTEKKFEQRIMGNCAFVPMLEGVNG
ncbi:MAG: protein-L-isoaspartate(D-aspartate) O-methyltransferase [Mangrovibacterium sp.]